MLFILVKIIVMGMVYQGSHLLEVPVYGSARSQANQPTKDLCDPLEPDCRSDFTPLSKLPYCSQYVRPSKEEPTKEKSDGGAVEVKPEKKSLRSLLDIPKEAMHKGPLGGPEAECTYWDAAAMTQGRTPVPGTIFLPTRIIEHHQIKGCEPTEENQFSCDTRPWVLKPGTEKKMSYIAEVERFRLLINQAFQSDLPGQDLSGRAGDFDAYIHGTKHLQNMKTEHQGFVAHLADKLKAVVKHWHIPAGRPNASIPFETVYSTAEGDVMSVGDVMKLADARGAAMLDQPRADGTTMRSQGAVISLNIKYSNAQSWDPFAKAKPTYTMTAAYMPMRYYKIEYQEMFGEVSKEGRKTERRMVNVHGILVLMRVYGSIRVFSLSHLLQILTTAMVSLAMARTLTDYIMMYCFDMSGKYTIIKYQPTMDFGVMRTSLAGVKKKYGANYDHMTNKAVPHADILNNAAEAALKAAGSGSDLSTWKGVLTQACPQEELLPILLKFEQRLNRLDGMDDCNAVTHPSDPDDMKDPGARCLNAWELAYEQETFNIAAALE